MPSGGFKSLKVYRLSYELAMDVFELSRSFPKEETYSLTDQIRRSSRSVCGNISESYRKRMYPKHFVNKLTDADSEASETIVWLDFARDCKYLTDEAHKKLTDKYLEVGKMLGYMIQHPEMFLPKKK